MADAPINLNKARKAKARAEAKQCARANRAKFGQPGTERRAQALRQATDAKKLDGHKREAD